MVTEDAILVENLAKHYGEVRALDGVSLRVPRGAFFGLLGANGAGKTTLIGVLGGLVRPTAGRAAVLGNDAVADTLKVRRALGVVPQEAVYDPFFTVREALIFQSKYFGLFNNRAWIDHLLARLELGEKANTNTRALSGGMKRRLMIAQALVHKPEVIVLDEPTAGVDIDLRLALWEFIKELNAEGRTIVLTTHYLEEAERLCSDIALLAHGRLAAAGKTKQLLRGVRSSARLRVRAAAPLPPINRPALRHLSPEEAEFEVGYDEVEGALAELRAQGATLAEMEISPPSLEDVFRAATGKSGGQKSAR